MSIKSRQVAGVTSLVLFIVASLSAYHLATLARMSLEESQARGELLRQMIFQRAREVVPRRCRTTAASARCSNRRAASPATSSTPPSSTASASPSPTTSRPKKDSPSPTRRS
jgi:hypothetical protein